MLDDHHGKPQWQHPSDQNTYRLGRIGEHNVVIFCLPAGTYGTVSAAKVASQMLSSFESIKVGLMVGIGGGVPSKERDVRLGDVVVSRPEMGLGGVVQYDFGKKIAGGRFQYTGCLNKPPQVLSTAAGALEAKHISGENKIPEFLSEMVKKYPEMRSKFSYQGVENDRLFEAEYVHIGDSNTCDDCEASRLMDRPVQSRENVPVIHYGTIASGNQVVKDGATRDRLRQTHNVLCFEMEAAGVIESLPCLVIRGICDYTDSHKNKRWQEYAAATAAAYAKELLHTLPRHKIAETLTTVEVVGE
jgi:nucleoside phosphorylase